MAKHIYTLQHNMKLIMKAAETWTFHCNVSMAQLG